MKLTKLTKNKVLIHMLEFGSRWKTNALFDPIFSRRNVSVLSVANRYRE